MEKLNPTLKALIDYTENTPRLKNEKLKIFEDINQHGFFGTGKKRERFIYLFAIAKQGIVNSQKKMRLKLIQYKGSIADDFCQYYLNQYDKHKLEKNQQFADGKYILIGEIEFNGAANILRVDKAIECKNQKELNVSIDYAENNSLDYVIPQDYSLPITFANQMEKEHYKYTLVNETQYLDS